MKHQTIAIIAALVGGFTGAASAQAPANDNFANAVVVSSYTGFVTGTNIGGSRETGEPAHLGNNTSPTVWYRWTAPINGPVSFYTNTFGATLDAILAVYTGSAVGNLAPVAESADLVNFNATAGTTYQIAVLGNDDHIGDFDLSWFQESDGVPLNDHFANAQLIAGPSGAATAAAGATSEGFLEDVVLQYPVVWYRWVAPSSGLVGFGLSDGNGSLYVDMFRGANYASLRRLTPGYANRVGAYVTAGATYYIAVGGFDNQTVDLQWQMVGPAGVVELAGTSPFYLENFGVTEDVYFADEKAGVLKVTVRRYAGTTGTAMVDYSVAASDPNYAAFEPATADDDFSPVFGTLTFAPGETEKTISIPILNDAVQEGSEEFFVSLSDPQGGVLLGLKNGARAIIYDDESDPPNDDFVNATPIFGVFGNRYDAGLSGADPEASEPPIHGTGRTIWYRWTPPVSGLGSLTQENSLLVEVFTSDGNSPLQSVATNQKINPNSDPAFPEYYLDSRTTFGVSAGKTYFIRIDGSYLGSSEPNELNLSWSIATGGAIRFDAGAFEANEDAGVLNVKIVREFGLDNYAAVQFSTQENGAVPDVDYTPVTATVVFAPGETTRIVPIPLLDDSDVEGDELIGLFLRSPSGAVLAGADPNSPELYSAAFILDDDDDPANDAFANRVNLVGAGTGGGTTRGASTEAGEPAHGKYSVWYQWTAPAGAGVERFSFASSEMSYPRISIYTGGNVSALTEVASRLYEVSFAPVPGTVYSIAVSADGNEVDGFSPGNFQLTRSFDNTLSIVSFDDAAGEFSALENSPQIAVHLKRTGALNSSVTVHYYTSDSGEPGAAISGEDYTPTDDTVTFGVGQTQETILVPLLDDPFVEGDEYFYFFLNDPSAGVTLGPDGSIGAILTIVDDESIVAPPSNDQFANAEVVPGAGGYLVGLNDGATGEPGEPAASDGAPARHTLWYAWTPSASGPALLSIESATFAPALRIFTGASLASLTPAFDVQSGGSGNVTAGTKYFISVDSAPAGDGSAATGDFAILVTLGTAGALEIAGAEVFAGEDGGSAAVTIQRVGSTAGSLSVNLRTEGGTATAGDDYTAVDTLVTFAPGEVSKTVPVPIVNDTLVEGTETVGLVLYNAIGGALITTPAATLFINDDEDDPANDRFANAIAISGPFGTTTGVSTGAGFEAGEADHAGAAGGQSIWYRWTAPTDGAVTFHTNGSTFDTVLAAYTGGSVAVLAEVASNNDISPGNTRSEISFAATVGTVYHIAIDGHAGAAGTAVLQWDMPQAGTIQFSPVVHQVSESGGSVQLHVARLGGTDGAVTIHYTTVAGTAGAGTDFTATTGDLPFAEGQSSAMITVPLINDAGFEAAETFTIVLSAPTGAALLGLQNVATVNIANDDAFAPQVSNFAALITGDGGSGLLNLTIGKGGSFSGKVFYGGKSYGIKGMLDAFGASSVTVPRKTGTPLTVALQIGNGGKSVAGRVYDGTAESDLAGERAHYDGKTLLAPQAGAYTFAIEPTSGAPGIPQGFGVGAMKVSLNGTVVIAGGILADGAKVAAKAFITESGKVLLYVPLYKGGGSISGEITFRNLALTDADAVLAWFKPPNVPGEKLFVSGFDTAVTLHASRYAKPAKDTRLVAGFNATDGDGSVLLTDGNLAADIAADFNLAITNKAAVAVPNVNGISLSPKTADGSFGGAFTPTGGKKTILKGVFLQKANRGLGLFFGTTESGAVELAPQP